MEAANLIVGDNYLLQKKLGAGSFGDIYAALDLQTKKSVAVKLEKKNAKLPQLQWEGHVYQQLHSGPKHVPCFPKAFWMGEEGEFNCLVIEMLGPNTEDLFAYCGKRFSMKTICMLAVQMIDRLEHFHSRGLLHRDLKPENFCLGAGPFNGHHVYLIDYGLAKQYTKKGVHVEFRSGRALTGTVRYASINAHLGNELSRRDDMESLAFILIYYHLGSLPWQGLKGATKEQKDARISEKKISSSAPELLCRGMPRVFHNYLAACRSLSFEEAPDYNAMRAMWTTALADEAATCDYMFDWITRWQARKTGPETFGR